MVTAVLLFFFASSQRGGAQESQLWQGAFDLGDVRGGLELRVGAENGDAGLRVRMSPRGRLETPKLSNIKIAASRIEFDADVERERYRFSGARKGKTYTGTMSPVGKRRAGSWRVARVDAAATPEPMKSFPRQRGNSQSVERLLIGWIPVEANSKPKTPRISVASSSTCSIRH